MPSTVLVDTNVAIYLATGHSLAERYRAYLGGERVTHNLRDFADIPDLTVISEAPGAH